MSSIGLEQAWQEIESMKNVDITQTNIVECCGKVEHCKMYSFHSVGEMLDALRNSTKAYVRIIRCIDYRFAIGRYSVIGYIHNN